MKHRLLPEWAAQEAVILAWPDEQTDWAPWLSQVEQVYVNLIQHINAENCAVVLLIRPEKIARFHQLAGDAASVLLVKADYNDTWLRDYGFLTLDDLTPVEYTFNGWGNKFDASKDNQINQQIFAAHLNKPLQTIDMVCEGGALEIDAEGHLLSTSLCLQNPERNGEMPLAIYKKRFMEFLGATKVSIYENGHLEGDDTDGHIDTLVRFTPDKGLVIQSCYNRPQDDHFAGLQALVEEVRADRPDCQIFELPLPEIFNQDGERLPASYANYLINNGQVLCPVYQQPEDDEAIAVMQKAYPNHRIVAVNCLPLVQQFGSLHCISMQVPVGTFKPTFSDQFGRGVIEL